MNCTLCNMCMIEDVATGCVLVQHRLPKATNPWCGLTFPGGHVEAGESITTSTIHFPQGTWVFAQVSSFFLLAEKTPRRSVAKPGI